MIKKSSIAAMLVVTAVAAHGLAQEVRLERKLNEGGVYTTEVKGGIDQTLTIAGMDIETNVQTHTVSTSRVSQRADDGTVRVKEKVDSLQINMGGTQGDYSFDSGNPDDKGSSPLEMLRPIHKVLANRVHTVIYDEDNRVKDIETDEDFLASLSTEPQTLVGDQLDTETLKQETNQSLAALPDEPVRKGATWERTESANFGAGQIMTFDVTYTYLGSVQHEGRKLDKISLKVESVDFSLEENAALPLQLKDSKLKIASSEGFILFDSKAGQFVANNQKTRIKGDLTFVANGNELPSHLDLTVHAVTNVIVK